VDGEVLENVLVPVAAGGALRHVSLMQIRQAGFGAAMSTEETFRWAFSDLADRGVLPPLAELAPRAKAPTG
jgi:hypothetical protein